MPCRGWKFDEKCDLLKLSLSPGVMGHRSNNTPFFSMVEATGPICTDLPWCLGSTWWWAPTRGGRCKSPNVMFWKDYMTYSFWCLTTKTHACSKRKSYRIKPLRELPCLNQKWKSISGKRFTNPLLTHHPLIVVMVQDLVLWKAGIFQHHEPLLLHLPAQLEAKLGTYPPMRCRDIPYL